MQNLSTASREIHLDQELLLQTSHKPSNSKDVKIGDAVPSGIGNSSGTMYRVLVLIL